MDADRPLKKLLALQARDVLPLMGDRGALVQASVVPELVAVTRRLDYVLRLTRDGEVYLRHIEFEMRCRKGLALRMFEYGAALAARYRLPVASTVIVLKGEAPRSLLYEERVGGRWVCLRRIGVVRLSAMRAAEVLRLGPGGAALAGLVGRPDVRVLKEAARRIEAGAPREHVKDLLTILRMLSEGRYTAQELEQIVQREVVMGSSLFAGVVRRSRAEGEAKGEAKGRAEGEAKGREEGETTGARLLCTELVKELHPTIVAAVKPVLDACNDAQRLRRWALAAPRTTDSELVRMIALDVAERPSGEKAPSRRPAKKAKPHSSRGRVSRPSRRAK